MTIVFSKSLMPKKSNSCLFDSWLEKPFPHLRCGKHELKVFLIVLSQWASNKTDSNLMKNCICNLFPLFYSVKMQNFNSRLETFKEWPNTNVKPEDLANAGFFYTGTIWKCKLLSPIFYLHYLSPLIYGYFNRTH